MTVAQVADVKYLQPRLASISLLPDLLAASKLMRDRLSAIAYIKADIDAELRVQATPFVQGALYMWYSPMEDAIDPWRQHLSEHLRSITSYPGVELNLQHPTRAVTLHIPYTAEDQMVPTQSNNHFGRLNLSVLSQLAGIDSPKASFSIVLKLKNIELYGMVPTDLSRQGDGEMPGFRAVHEHLELERPGSVIREGVHFMVDGKRSKHTQRKHQFVVEGEDEKASSKGIISSVADSVGSVANVLSNVPVIGEIAKPVSWIAGAVSGVASLFGFSKVMDMEKNAVYTNLPARGFTNLEGIDQSVNLSALPNNMVSSTLSFTSKDEMSIPYIFKRPFMAGHARWSTSDDTETVIAQLPIAPAPTQFRASGSGNVPYFLPPSGVVASMFKWWRGCPVFQIKFAKTQFHQGRLLVQYTPAVAPAGNHPINEVYTVIVDLSTVDHHGVKVDFTSVMPNKWLPTDPWQSPSSGSMTISVLNPLVAADTVADFVDIYAWMHWENMELAEPGSALRVHALANNPPDTVVTAHEIELEEGATTVTIPSHSYPGTISQYPTTWDYNTEVNTNTTDFINVKTTTEFKHTSARLSEETEIRWNNAAVAGSKYSYITWSPPTARPVVTRLTLEDGRFRLSAPCVVSAYDTAFREEKPAKVSHTDKTYFEVVFNASNGGIATSTPMTVPNSVFDIDVVGKVTLYCIGAATVVARPSRQFVVEGVDDVTPNAKIDSSNMTTTMGETIVSLRALSRRFTKVDTFLETWTGKPMKGVGIYSSQQQSLAGIISYLYRFQRGSWRYKFVATQGDLISVSGQQTAVGDSEDQLGALHIQDLRLNPIVEVNKPFYSPTDMIALSHNDDGLRSGVYFSSLGSPAKGIVLEATGDDHSFHFLVGAPVVVLNLSQ
ncbi:hypothetical protein 2 [Beihai picorna-like virus 90]|uniref:hypothetical protein 2 n=1 Tax=Beihai picorna-like virus 90 TaxID=1922637 RepID=UPI000909C234|nr:hypothetical protein 2 [Beihai picorna-like virus 90]APG76898.1 hypothetical protein 2 [Beihai picorna-like virus 90]